MPIVLRSLASSRPRPKPPSMVVWLVLCIVVMLTGVALTLLTWPAGVSTSTPRFWLQLLAAPALAWCFLFGLRLHFYEDENHRIDAEEEVHRQDREEAIFFGSEPLAVLDFAYRCAMGEGAAKKILNDESVLTAHKPRSDLPSMRHSRLPCMPVFEAEDVETTQGASPHRLHLVFMELLEQLAPTLKTLAIRIPLDVRLQVCADVPGQTVIDSWRDCWAQHHLSPVMPTLLAPSEGLMCLDTWLDIQGGPALEKYTLVAAVQLHVDPPENSAESAVALLLGWAPLVEREGIDALARLHRPSTSEAASLNENLSSTLLWGHAKAPEVLHVWQAGLRKEESAALLKSAGGLGLGAVQGAEFPGLHSVDRAIGTPGIASAWQAVAFAVENAGDSNTPQLIVAREDDLRLAIIQPVAKREQSNLVVHN